MILSIFIIAFIVFGMIGVGIMYAINSSKSIDKPISYYILIFILSNVICLLVSGLVCGIMFSSLL
ncbi:hypothetical protein EG240_12160 [Paenimyroides tangerinum]|uniref:Uncharacterized protein n=1 Tax=Paenimyroides tangerinum TaxID=2488728 RepID=A0A3P3W4H2_9FLAO|nr:hypothetical protein [Paenimyroides tangerinum]RRJ89308.1 hypothetical protein EG240_12160 [Paenimyroides tangerinum]